MTTREALELVNACRRLPEGEAVIVVLQLASREARLAIAACVAELGALEHRTLEAQQAQLREGSES